MSKSIMSRRLLAVLVSVAMLFAFMPLINGTANAEDGEWDLYWDLSWSCSVAGDDDYSNNEIWTEPNNEVLMEVVPYWEDEAYKQDAGDDYFTYQWQKGTVEYDDEDVDDDGTFVGTEIANENGPSLTVTSDKPTEETVYRCIVTGKGGRSEYRDFTVQFRYKVADWTLSGKINNVEGEDDDIKLGKNATMKVFPDIYYDSEEEGEIAPKLTFKWERCEYDENKDEPVEKEVIEGAVKDNYIVENVRQDLYFKCTATDQNGDSDSVYFSLYCDKSTDKWALRSKINGEQDDTVRIFSGSSATMEVFTYFEEGVNKDKYKFTYRWEKATYDEATDTYDTEPVKGVTSKKYTVNNVKKDVTYICIATDNYGYESQLYFYVKILTKDQIAAKKVADKIFKLKPINKLTLKDKAAVMAAKKAFNALTKTQKEEFRDIFYKADYKLTDALEKIRTLEKIKKAKVAKVSKLKAKSLKKKRVRLSWNKCKGVSGYVVLQSSKKKGKFKKVATIKKAATVKLTSKKIKKGKKVFFKVRPFTKISGKAYYGKDSAVAAKVKK